MVFVLIRPGGAAVRLPEGCTPGSVYEAGNYTTIAALIIEPFGGFSVGNRSENL
jgi:hypothetical protein